MQNINYIKHPTTIKILIQELKQICDDYLARKITEDELRYFIQCWANNGGKMLFDGQNQFNPTITQRVGAKRLHLVKKMLEGFQYTI